MNRSATLPPSLLRLVKSFAATSRSLTTYRGEARLETANTVYRFKDATFSRKARKPDHVFESPAEMKGLVLVGFLVNRGGLYAMSASFRHGAHAVLWNPALPDAFAFTVTSAAIGFALLEGEEAPRSGVIARDSLTRIHAAAAR